MYRIPDLPYNATLEDLIERVSVLQGMVNGYSPFGVPTYLTQWDGLDTTGAVSTEYANNISTNEATAGRALRVLDGLDRILARADNAGWYSERPWETTNTLKVGLTSWLVGNVGIGQASGSFALGVTGNSKLTGTLLVTSTSQLDGKVGIGQAPATQQLEVTGTSHFTSRMGVGAAPDATVMLKVTGDQWITSKLGVGATVGTETLVVTGTQQVTQRLGVGAAPDGTAALKVTGTSIFTDDMAIDTTDNLFFADVSANFVGIMTATPAATLDVSGMIRATNTMTPASGAGVEILYNTASSFGNILCYDRTGAAYKELRVQGLSVSLRASGVDKLTVDGTGIGFFGVTPVTQPTVSGTRTGTLAQLQSVVADLLNELDTMGLINDTTT